MGLILVSNDFMSFVKGYNVLYLGDNETLKVKDLDRMLRLIFGMDSENRLSEYIARLIDLGFVAWAASFYMEIEEEAMFSILQGAIDKVESKDRGYNIKELFEECREKNSLEPIEGKVYSVSDKDKIPDLIYRFEKTPAENTEECLNVLKALWQAFDDDEISWSSDNGKLMIIGMMQTIDKMEKVIGNYNALGEYYSNSFALGDAGFYYEFLMNKDYYTGKEKEYNEPNFNRFEKMISEHKQIGSCMYNVMLWNFDIIHRLVNINELISALSVTAVFYYHSAKSQNMAEYLIKYYPYLDYAHRTKLYMIRIMVQTALNIKDINISYALMSCFISESRLHELNVVDIKKKAAEGIKASIELIWNISKEAADNVIDSEKTVDDRAKDIEKFIWEDIIKWAEIKYVTEATINEYSIPTLIQMYEYNLLHFFGLEEKPENLILKLIKLYVYNLNLPYILGLKKKPEKLGYKEIIVPSKDLPEKINKTIKRLKIILMELKACIEVDQPVYIKDVLGKVYEEICDHIEAIVIENIKDRQQKIDNSINELNKDNANSISELDKDKAALDENEYENRKKEIQDEYEKREKEILDEYDSMGEQIRKSLDSVPFFANVIKESRKSYSRYKGEIEAVVGDEDLLSHVSEGVRGQIENELFTSELIASVFRGGMSEETNIDYSVAILPLTKAIELIMNDLFARIEDGDLINGLKLSNKRFFFEKQSKKNHIELGNAAKLFDDINIDIDNGYTFQNWWNQGDKYVDLSLLARCFTDESFSLPTEEENGISYKHFEGYGKAHEMSELQDKDKTDDKNREILMNAMLYIKDRYRNPVAHTASFGSQAFDECKELLISGQKLMWILLAIIKK